MKKSLVITAVVVVLLFFMGYSFLKSTYNGMVEREENVRSQWSQVENVYQRRSDLIPNLVNTVKGYAKHEQTTLTAVIDARAKATSININPDKLDASSLKKYQQAQGELSSALGRLMVVSEQYPDLKANQNFLDLQAQLEGTENRITTERMRFNQMTQDYNKYIRKFPQNMFAGMFGFSQKVYFEAEKGAEKAPEVKF
ncbi:MAG: LemA family protein [Bacteroidota bacterium]|nr:LemA family protein [Bacteroidota bacterium]MDP4206881.1 LemA family protein [Bacteroidota bacterium]